MPDETELEDSQQNLNGEEGNKSPDGDKETQKDSLNVEGAPQEKVPEPTEREKRLYARLKKEQSRRKEAEEKIRSVPEDKISRPSVKGEKSAEDEAREYLRGLSREVVKEILEERKQAKKERQSAEDKEYEEMLDEFKELDSSFDEEQFNELVAKFKPQDKDAAWDLWREFKNRPISKEREKPKMPSGKKTIDNLPEKLLGGKDLSKPLHQILEEAKREHGII